MSDTSLDSNYKIVQWSETQFTSNRQQWGELIANSEADPIYCSWDWMHNWWLQRKKSDDELAIFVLYQKETIQAIAPFYIEHSSYIKGIFRTSRLQFLGTRFSDNDSIRAEYLQIIARRDLDTSCLEHLINQVIKNKKWSELNLSDEKIDSSGHKIIANLLDKNDFYRRIDSTGETYAIDCQPEFSAYLSNLGKNTRLKFYNRRKLLESFGKVSLEFINSENKDQFYRQLNQWYQSRWGMDVLDESKKAFIESVFIDDSNDLSLEYSCLLKLEDRPLSVMINLSDKDKVYNLLLAYEENFNKKIALGTLHIGYLTEQLFENPQIHVFDLLEGKGKHSNYKAKLAKKRGELVSSRSFRSLSLKFLFKFYDKFIRK